MRQKRTTSLATGLAAAFALGAGWTIGSAAAADYTIRIAAAPPEGDIRYEAVDCMAERIPQATDEQVAVEVFKGTLGGEREILERLTLGTIEGYMGSTGPLESLTGEPIASLYDVPYLFRDWEHLYQVANSEIGEQLHEKLRAKGIHVLDYVSMGTRAVYTRNAPVNQPDDLKELKVRVMENPVYIEMYKEFGATPVPMSWTEIYTALQTGVLDGVDGSLSSGLASKHTESAKYVTFLGNHVVIASILAVSDQWWQNLPEDLRQTISEVTNECALLEQKRNEEYQAELMQEWRDAGVEFTDSDRDKFASIAREKVYPIVYEKIGEDLINQAMEMGK